MPDQIIEIMTPGTSLQKNRGFIEVSNDTGFVGRVAIDDALAIIIGTPGCSVSTNLLDVLSTSNIPIVICGNNYNPSSITLPLVGHSRQFVVMNHQAKVSEPRRKRAWQQLVRAKISAQNEVLNRAGRPADRMLHLIGRVRSGDPDNIEAQAARIYWRALFGSDFRRDRDQVGVNSSLNYAYAVLRACVARALCASGLHPSFSLHHRNARNPLNLADDLIEPLRPIADYLIFLHEEEFSTELAIRSKQKLASLVNIRTRTSEGLTPLSLATVKMCRSLADYYAGEIDTISTPLLPRELDYNDTQPL
ncbi:type II CRISPR-associated endonuclease Cas1 [Alphaproteobacteria bacterium]|nr:type II CRISPR-associated endonuclease Cas1 [Alphaproteobacteria bacterium]